MNINPHDYEIQHDDIVKTFITILYPINARQENTKGSGSNLFAPSPRTSFAESPKMSFKIPFSNKVIGSNELNINPPVLPLGSEVTPEARKLFEHLTKICKMHHDDTQQIVSRVLTYTTPDVTIIDTLSYLFLTKNGMTHPSLQSFVSHGDFEQWRSSEVGVAEQLLKLCATVNDSVPKLDPNQSSLFVLNVLSASKLSSKDENGSSNPYWYISSTSRQQVSSPLLRTVNPSWPDKPFIFFGYDNPITISLWNYPSKVGEKHAFLGFITLMPHDLKGRMNSGPFTIPLQKRSSKSNISGTITVSLSSLDTLSRQGVEEMYRHIFASIPPNPYSTFFSILSSSISYDNQQGRREETDEYTSPETELLLGRLATNWRIRSSFRMISRFSVLVTCYEQQTISASTLYREGYIKLLKYMKGPQETVFTLQEKEIMDKSLSSLRNLVPYQIRQFFTNESSRKNISSPASYVEAILSMYLGLEDSVSPTSARLGTRVTDILVPILEARVHGLEAIANTSDTSLLALCGAIADELSWIHGNFDMLLFETVHIPSLAAKSFLACISHRLTEFSASYKAVRPDMSDVFELYMTVKQLRDVYNAIDFRLAERFDSMDWFQAFIEEWFRNSDIKTLEWVKNSLNADNLERFSELVFHSSSVLDIFTSFQQQLDFIVGLEWPNESQNKAMVARIIHQSIKGIDHYMSLLKNSFVSYQSAYVSKQPATHPSMTKLVKTTKRMEKVIKRKLRLNQGKQIATQELQRIDPKALVILINILSLHSHFESFVHSIPQPLLRCDAIDKSFIGAEQHVPVQLKIVCLANALIQPPWAMTIAFKLSTCVGREVGRSPKQLQSLNLKCGHDFNIILTEREFKSELQLGLLAHILPNKETLRKLVPISLTGLNLGYNATSFQIDMAPFGNLLITAKLVNELDASFYDSVLQSSVESVIDTLFGSISKKILSEFVDAVHEVSVTYKVNPMKALLKAVKSPSSATLLEARVNDDLSTCFDLLDANFGIIMETMDTDHALLLIKYIWKELLEFSEELVVPSLFDGGNEQKPWDDQRLQFFSIYLNTLEEFFEGDGEGMSREAIEIPSYMRLKQIMELYNLTAEALQDEYIRIQSIQSAGQVERSMSHDKAVLDGILKLLKMRGETGFVQAELQRRTAE